MKLEVVRRPVVLEVGSGKAQLTSILSQIEAVVGRAAAFGITDPTEARAFTAETQEADFTSGYYREGYTVGGLTGIPGWTFSRSSVATLEPEGGEAEVVAANVPRVTNRGLRIEAGSIQGLGYSSAFGSWGSANVTVGDAAPDYLGQPAKSVTATGNNARLDLSGAGSSDVAPNTTVWFIVKKGSGALEANTFAVINTSATPSPTTLIVAAFNYDTGEITTSTGLVTDCRAVALGEGWWRLEFRPSTGIADGDGLKVYAGFIGGDSVAGQYFTISHAQAENLAVATSRIINNTGAPMDRASDSARINFTPRGDFTVVMEVALRDARTTGALFSIDDGTLNNRLSVSRISGALTLQSISGGVETAASYPDKGGARRLRVAISSSGRQTRMSVDGEEVVVADANRPRGLVQMWLGLFSDVGQGHLNGDIRSLLIRSRASSDAELRTFSRPLVRPLSEAPLTGLAMQGRYFPTGGTPAGDYGLGEAKVYGELPCDLLICERMGPSALGVSQHGATMFRDRLHLGLWIDTDLTTGACLVGLPDGRTIRWLDRNGAELNRWTVPVEIPGTIYGLRVTGGKLVLNLEDSLVGETWIWNLDGNGYPVGTPGEFASFAGAGMLARSFLIRNDSVTGLPKLWIASLTLPLTPQGTEGAVQVYDIGTGVLEVSYPAHYPNDLDLLPNGNVVWVDEHLDRVRMVVPETGAVTTLMAGTAVRAAYELAVSSVSANDLATRALDGSRLSAAAVEYRGINGLYSPNGISVITADTFAIADTDNSRVIIVRLTDTWEPRVVAVIAHLNEPTRVRPIRPSIL